MDFYWRESLAHKKKGLEFGPSHRDRDCIVRKRILDAGTDLLYIIYSLPSSYPCEDGPNAHLHTTQTAQAAFWRIVRVTPGTSMLCTVSVTHCLVYGELKMQQKKVANRLHTLPEQWLARMLENTEMPVGRALMGEGKRKYPSHISGKPEVRAVPWYAFLESLSWPQITAGASWKGGKEFLHLVPVIQSTETARVL